MPGPSWNGYEWNAVGIVDMPGPAQAAAPYDAPASLDQAYAMKKPKPKIFSENLDDPISEVFGVKEPAIISPEVAEKFLKHHPQLTSTRPFALQNPKTLVGIEVEVENVMAIDPNIGLMFWTMKEDGSLRNNGREFVTPGVIPASLAEPALKLLFNGLNQDIDFSNRASIHVHVDARQLTLQQMVSLLLTYLTVENLLFKFVGNSRRSNIFCTPISETGIIEHISANPKKFIHSIQGTWMKYTALNLLPITSFGSVEFRHMPGTNNVNKLLAWIDIITRLKQFVYRFQYDEIVKTIMALNSNSRYRQYVELVFGDMIDYLDTSNLLTDMEKPIYLAKNCAAANAFHAEVIAPNKIKINSQLLDKIGSWMASLTVDQQKALVEFAQALGNNNLEGLFRDITARMTSYVRNYPDHAHLVRRILGVSELKVSPKKVINTGGF